MSCDSDRSANAEIEQGRDQTHLDEQAHQQTQSHDRYKEDEDISDALHVGIEDLIPHLGGERSGENEILAQLGFESSREGCRERRGEYVVEDGVADGEADGAA